MNVSFHDLRSPFSSASGLEGGHIFARWFAVPPRPIGVIHNTMTMLECAVLHAIADLGTMHRPLASLTRGRKE